MIPLSPLVWLRLGAILATFSAGVWVGIQWQEDAYDSLVLERAENDRDEARADLKAQTEQAQANESALRSFYESKLKTAKGRVTRVEIEKLVPADCHVPGPAVGLLEAHRSGVPDSPGVAGSAPAGPVPGDLPLTALIHADADLADLYNLCRSQIEAIGRAVR